MIAHTVVELFGRAFRFRGVGGFGFMCFGFFGGLVVLVLKAAFYAGFGHGDIRDIFALRFFGGLRGVW